MPSSCYRHVLLISKTRHEPARRLAREIASWLAEREISSELCEADILDGKKTRPEGTLAVVLGGDGTILGIGRKLAQKNIPILGINFGKIGFLTLVSPKTWQPSLERCLAGEIPLQPRLALNWSVLRKGNLFSQGHAVNDVVLSHGRLARLICVDITINNEQMGFLRCDGIILATPVGSSSYTASAGGPILFPNTEAYVFTPICPFFRSISPMVFPSTVVVDLRMASETADCYLTVDGQEGFRLCADDTLRVTATAKSVLFLGQEEVFLDRLRMRALALEQTYTLNHSASKSNSKSCQD